jgi:hypothetical protein
MAKTRKIAALVVADIVGYSRIAGRTKTARYRGSEA